MEPRVGNKFRLGRKIGSRSFGEISGLMFRPMKKLQLSCSGSLKLTLVVSRRSKEHVVHQYLKMVVQYFLWQGLHLMLQILMVSVLQ
ncbi:hypothetical protein P3L10_009621 [Capsicum annuum]